MQLNEHIGSFELPSTGGIITDQNFVGKKTVLFFYPKANTPGCAQESKDFVSLYSQFVEKNTQIFGISKDGLKAQENFKKKFMMPFELISDEEQVLCKRFDVIKQKNIFGKKFIGISRSTFLLNSEGVLEHQWLDVKVLGHAQEVLDFIS